MSVYRVSPYVQSFAIDARSTVVGHPFFLEYSVLEEQALAIFNALREQASTPEALHQRLSIRVDIIDRALKFFKTRRFVLVDDENEDERIRNQVLSSRKSGNGIQQAAGRMREFRDYAALSLESLQARIPFERTRDVRVVILGGCLSQLAANAIEQLAPSYGISATVEANWPDRLASMDFENVQLLIFQPFNMWLLAPFWDGAPFLSEEERANRIEIIKDYLRVTLRDVLPRIEGRLLLVQGISTPTFSPLGAAEFRSGYSFRNAAHEINQTIVDAIRHKANAVFIDEENLLSNVGKLQLMDDSIALASHHGPIDSNIGVSPAGVSRAETFGIREPFLAPRLFAKTYLEAYVRWSGIARIKCVIVDLDNTLWPGVAGEEGFDLMGSRDARVSLAIGVFGGIHQALKTLKQQGVLLAICSRQNEADVLTAWAQIGDIVKEQEARHLLSLDDFAITRINWERKSGNIAEILQALGVGTDAALFIDDNPAERAEAQEAFPKLRVLGENLHIIRQTLLTDPCLQSDVQTSEAKSRTQMIKAQLERESAGKQFGDGLSFLRGLNISLKIIRRRNIDRVGMRIMELIQRTNQFNTTLTRYNHRELIDFVNQPEGAVYTLEASDRFASYGLVGVCLLWGDEIANFVMSCRVIPLSAAVPFLSATLLHYERRPLHANIVEGPRNQPCRSLYRDAGFAEVSPGRYQLRDLLNLHPVDSSIYRVDLIDESTLEKPISTPTAPQQNPASQTAYSFTED